MTRHADVVFTVAALIAAMIGIFDPVHRLIWFSLVFVCAGIVGAFLLRRDGRNKRAEEIFEIKSENWTLEHHNGEITGAHLVIPEKRHGKGRDVIVRIEQIELKRYDLKQPEIVDGNITIRYQSNNLPFDPRIPLRVYISGRG